MWGEYYGEGKGGEALEQMKQAAADEDSLDLYDDQGNYNTFEEIRKFCRKNGLTYTEHQDAYGESAESYVCWTPGWEKERDVLSSDGHLCIQKDELKRVMDEAVATDGGKDPFRVLKAIEDLLERSKLPDIPALTRKESAHGKEG